MKIEQEARVSGHGPPKHIAGRRDGDEPRLVAETNLNLDILHQHSSKNPIPMGEGFLTMLKSSQSLDLAAVRTTPPP